MPRLRSNDIDSPQDSIYGCGLCHLHALAACQVHEGPQGRFLVVEDHDELQWASEDDPDDYIPAVVHVYSLHETPSGTVARDILGDRPVDEAEEECREIYAVFNTSACVVDLTGLREYIQGNESEAQRALGVAYPLAAVDENGLRAACSAPSVTCPVAGRDEEPEP